MNPVVLDILTAFACVATFIEAVVVVVAIWPAINQLKESTRARQEAIRARSLDAFLALSKDLKEGTKGRKFIYTELVKVLKMTKDQQNEYLAKITDNDRGEVESVCVTLDRMGVLVAHELIPRDVAFSMYFDVVLKIWHVVEPFIREERRRRKSDIWMMYFEKLNAQCKEHWRALLDEKKEEWRYMKVFEDIYYYF